MEELNEMARNERKENAPKKLDDGIDKVLVEVNRITKVVTDKNTDNILNYKDKIVII